MKRILKVVLAVTTVLCCMMLVPALAESATGAPVFNWGSLITMVAVWAIGAIGGIAAWAVKKYLYPPLINVVIPWLKTHHLLELAVTAVNYAEAAIGRFNGETKLKMALDFLKTKGYDINSEEVLAAVKAAWESLNLQQIAAGVKGTEE